MKIYLFLFLIFLYGCNEINPSTSTDNLSADPLASPEPTNLVATQNSVTQITLSWFDGGGSTTGFKVVYKTGTTAPSSCDEGTRVHNENIIGTTAVVENLLPQLSYGFRVCSLNSDGDVSSGTTVSTTMPVDPPSLTATTTSTTQITLTWISSGVDYRIAYQTGATAPANCALGTVILESSISGTTEVVSGLTAGTQYSFRMCALSDLTDGSTASGSTFESAPLEPTGESAVADSYTQITLDWTSGGGSTSGYRISYTTGATAPADCDSGTEISEDFISGTSKAIFGLAANTQYSFRICSINDNDDPDVSDGVTVTATTLLAYPTNATAPLATVISSSQITLDWTAGGGTTSDYRISYATGATAPATCALGVTISEASITGVTHAVSGLSGATQYSFRICAINANPTPDVSSGVTVTATTNYAAPPNPTGLGAVVNSDTQITLSWTSGGGTTIGYRIAYQTGATAPADCTLGTTIDESQISGVSKAVTGLTSNTQYSFRVCAINLDQTPNVSSGVTVTATTNHAVPANPSGLATTLISTAQIDLVWISGGGSTSDFRIAYQTGATAPADCASGTLISEGVITGVDHSVTGLTSGTQYSFRVCAINANATPDVSSGVTLATATYYTAPPDPSGLIATVYSASQITLSWTSGGGSTSDYRIAYALGATAPATCALGTTIDESLITGTAKAVTDLSANTQFSFRVCAINANGAPDVSSGVTASATTSIGGDPFISIWRTTSDNESISLPLRSGYNYNFTVDWGDGTAISTITADNDPDITHTYADDGDYIVTMTGLAEAWYFAGTGSMSKLIEVVDLGNMGWINFDSAFMGCNNLTDFAGGNTFAVTNMNRMFKGNTSLVSLDLSSFDTSNVTIMDDMFYEVSSLTSIDVSNFNTSNVVTMSAMFGFTQSLTTLDLTSFNTSNVLNMRHMFIVTDNLTSVDLSSFDTSNVTDMVGMFWAAQSLVNLDLSNFDTTSVTDMSYMFLNTLNLTSLNVSSFNTSNVTNMSGMFLGTGVTTLNLSGFNTTNVTEMNRMFYTAVNLVNLDISNFNTSNVTDMAEMFWASTSLVSLNLSHFTTTNVLNMDGMFKDTTSLTSLNTTNWNITSAAASTDVFLNANAGLVVICDQDPGVGLGTFFGQTCN